jgi:hypothetical protein
VRGLTTAASIWTVAAIGLAVGGGLYVAAGLSTTIILAIFAGVKPLEEAYRDRNQTCRIAIETARGTLTPEILKDVLKVRNSQIKRFLARARDADVDDLTVILARVSSNDIASSIAKIKTISGVTKVKLNPGTRKVAQLVCLKRRRPPTEAALSLLVVELFGRDYTGLRIGVEVHLLAVLDAFAFPLPVIGFKFGNLRIPRLKNLLDYLLGGHPVRSRLIGPCEILRTH